MNSEIESRAILVKKKIEDDFKDMGEAEFEKNFDKFQMDRRTQSFIKYYNKTILDKVKIQFSEFKHQWAIQGMTKEIYTDFDINYDKFKKEIIEKKDIKDFFEKYCTKKRREGSFCSKLFHSFLPDEFPPVDNPIKQRFNLKNEDFILSVLIIKRGYELFIQEHNNVIDMIRKVLSKDKFSYLRIDELSDIRILDMYYWFMESRSKKL